jgi:hypothetical protein
VSVFLEAEEIFARFFFMAFLNSPCYETPKNAIKKNRTKPTEGGGGKKTEEKKAAFFVMSPDGLFRFFFLRDFELPWLQNAQKTPKKNSIKNKINEVSNYFFFSAAANVRHFRHFFFRAPP